MAALWTSSVESWPIPVEAALQVRGVGFTGPLRHKVDATSHRLLSPGGCWTELQVDRSEAGMYT